MASMGDDVNVAQAAVEPAPKPMKKLLFKPKHKVTMPKVAAVSEAAPIAAPVSAPAATPSSPSLASVNAAEA